MICANDIKYIAINMINTVKDNLSLKTTGSLSTFL